MTEIERCLSMLGFRAKDRITGLTGIITSVSFDLYGCIQGLLNPGVNEKKEMHTIYWFDVSRLELVTKEPVMIQPNFCSNDTSKKLQGPENKPIKV